jgi:hypothetical protein|tara:strand:- start:813 stop:1148 length:336 start_codon:yes stop_codon:yes gene_type:complete
VINQSNFENNEELVIEDIGMSDKIRSRVVKEKLPENLGAVMENMQAGQSVFIKATHVTNVKRKMYALRSKYYRWRQKNENDPHQFSFIPEADANGNTGIRIYKYRSEEDQR